VKRQRLQAFRALPLGERMMLIKAAVSFGVIRLLLAGVGFRRVVKLLERRSIQVDVASLPVERIVGLVNSAASAWRARDACVPRSVTSWMLLRAAGHDPAIRFGVERDSTQDFAAHAWIELDGRPIGEPPDALQRFTPLVGQNTLRPRT